MKRKITIIGAGNTGCALAADFKHRGFSVCLYAHPNHANVLYNIKHRGEMVYSGVINGTCLPDLLTTDVKQALAFSADIILALPSYAQESMFPILAPYIHKQHRIINLNGNFSSYILASIVADRRPLILETNSPPHASRVTLNGDVNILGLKQMIPISSLGVEPCATLKKTLADILPSTLEWHPDIMAVSLQAYNGVLHPAPMLLNVARVEDASTSFLFYRQGFSESVAKIVEKIDAERLQIANIYGYSHLRTTLEALNHIYEDQDFQSIFDFAQGAKVYQKIDAPNNIKSRYVSEDVPYILVPWYKLGLRCGYKAKTIRSIIDLASTVHDVDYMKIGRTLSGVMLPKLSAQQQKT